MNPNPGEVWRLDDGALRLVVSHATYNASSLGRVITCAVGDLPGVQVLDPFAVPFGEGRAVFADRIMMHPRPWLLGPAFRVEEPTYRQVRTHLRFLLAPSRS